MRERIKNDIKISKDVLRVIENSQRIVLSYKREIERKKMMTPDSMKHLKAALREFIFIQENYSSKYKIIEAITLKEDKLVNKSIRESVGGGDFSSQNIVMGELEKYFINNIRKFNWVIGYITPLIQSTEEV